MEIKQNKSEMTTINLMIPKSLKEQVKQLAANQHQDISKFVRTLLGSYVDGTLLENKIKDYHQQTFMNSIEFIKLLVWMYTKKEERKCAVTNDILEGYIKILKQVDHFLPREISLEFDKVLLDLLSVVREKSEYSRLFEFATGYKDSKCFDFSKFEAYILGRK